jgi:hypothetical protein
VGKYLPSGLLDLVSLVKSGIGVIAAKQELPYFSFNCWVYTLSMFERKHVVPNEW